MYSGGAVRRGGREEQREYSLFVQAVALMVNILIQLVFYMIPLATAIQRYWLGNTRELWGGYIYTDSFYQVYYFLVTGSVL